MQILGTRIDGIRRNEALDRVRGFLVSDDQHMVVTPNPEILVAAMEDHDFRDILNSASLSVPDGFGVILMGRLLGEEISERITGVDFLDDLMCLADETGHAVCFIGGHHDEIPRRAGDRFVERYPSLNIVHTESGGDVFLTDDSWEMDDELLNRIRGAEPAILIVGFGHGKQEKWINDFLSELPSVKVAMGVGGALDFWAGEIRRAPQWMRAIGFEWLWRLVHEPYRWKRIVTAVIIFPFYIFKDHLLNRHIVP